MMYIEWIQASIAAIVVYALLGYAWAWWVERNDPPGE
jgi:hypothetical protein